MNNIEILNNDRSLEEIRELSNFVISETTIDTTGHNGSNKVLSALFIGASLISTSQSVQAKKINFVDIKTENCLKLTKEYDNTVNIPFTKYINEISFTKDFVTKQNIIRNILSFKSLNQSWDGFNAIPLEIDSATNTIQLIDLIGEKLFCKIKDYYPNPNGTISLEWVNNLNEKISVEVGNNSYSYFVELASKEVQFFNKQKINSKDAQILAEFIQTL